MITTYLSALMIHLSCIMNSVLIGFRSLPSFVVLELGPQAGRFVLNTIVILRESKTLPRAAGRVFFS